MSSAPIPKRDIYWGVEQTESGFYLHAFNSPVDRSRWIQETQGITVHTPGGRGLPTDLLAKDNPLRGAYDRPVFWHD